MTLGPHANAIPSSASPESMDMKAGPPQADESLPEPAEGKGSGWMVGRVFRHSVSEHRL